MAVTTAVGVSYYIKPDNAPKVFQKYRRGVDEITDVYLRAMIRDALNNAGAKIEAEDAYGPGREKLQSDVQMVVAKAAAEVGIEVEKIYFVGKMELPPEVITSINNKIKAAQDADKKETELRGAEADAAKAIAQARGDAEATRIKGEALRSNPQVLQQQLIEKWDGKLPVYQAGNANNTIKLPEIAK